MTNNTTFPHRVSGRLSASDLMEITQYCRTRDHKFHLDGRVDRRPRPVKLWFAEPEVAAYFTQKFSLKG